MPSLYVYFYVTTDVYVGGRWVRQQLCNRTTATPRRRHGYVHRAVGDAAHPRHAGRVHRQDPKGLDLPNTIQLRERVDAEHLLFRRRIPPAGFRRYELLRQPETHQLVYAGLRLHANDSGFE